MGIKKNTSIEINISEKRILFSPLLLKRIAIKKAVLFHPHTVKSKLDRSRILHSSVDKIQEREILETFSTRRKRDRGNGRCESSMEKKERKLSEEGEFNSFETRLRNNLQPGIPCLKTAIRVPPRANGQSFEPSLLPSPPFTSSKLLVKYVRFLMSETERELSTSSLRSPGGEESFRGRPRIIPAFSLRKPVLADPPFEPEGSFEIQPRDETKIIQRFALRLEFKGEIIFDSMKIQSLSLSIPSYAKPVSKTCVDNHPRQDIDRLAWQK